MSYSSATSTQIPHHEGVKTSISPNINDRDDAPRLIAADDGRIIFSNAAFAQLCLREDIVEGEYITDLFTFDRMQDFSQDGSYAVRLNSNQQDMLLQFNWVDTPEGGRFLVASAEEITAREKLLQYVAQRIEEKKTNPQNSIFDSLSLDAHCVIHMDGKFSEVNSNFSHLLGYSQSDLNSINILNIIHPDEREAFQNMLHNMYYHDQNSQPDMIETKAIAQNGDIFFMQWRCKKDGNKFYFIARDETPVKIYQDSLKQQQKKLLEAEAIGHIGQWRWKVGDEAIDFSAQLYEIFGLSPNEFHPTLDNINSMIHSRDSGRMGQVFQRAIIEQNDYDMDFRITRPDGEIRHIKCEGRCEIDAEDDVIALYGIMQDVSEATKREMDLKIAKESVERAYAAKTQFLANMSHELRTPLNAIIGFSEMMERQLLGPIGSEKYIEYIKGIRESGEHLLDLISDILDMSKIEAGKYELSLEKFNIAKVIRMAAHMMEGRALDQNIKINIDLEDEDLNIIADRRAILQTTLNVLSNAVKFSKENGIVYIKLHKRDGHFSIHFNDQGIGIPANKLANITMPFEQAESHYTREYEGSGLGLAITKELVEIHGGSLHIESQLDVGTNVIIRLPYDAHKANKA